MSNELAIKVFKMDYDFLLKNYLNPEMWQKVWTLFEYKTFKVTLNIYSIRTKEEKIMFDVRVYHRDLDNPTGDSYIEKCPLCSLKIEDISFLKRQINTSIFEAMEVLERAYFIRTTDKYHELERACQEEKLKLRKYASEFLTEAGVTNEHLRDAYIDAYIDEFAKMPEYKDDYEESQQYKILTDLYLVWLSSLEDDDKANYRMEKIRNRLSTDEYEEALKKLEEHQKYIETKEFEDEMKSNLEEV